MVEDVEVIVVTLLLVSCGKHILEKQLSCLRDGTLTFDDLLHSATVRNLRDHTRSAVFKVVREDLHISVLARRVFPEWVVEHVPKVPLGHDILVTNMEYLLAPAA